MNDAPTYEERGEEGAVTACISVVVLAPGQAGLAAAAAWSLASTAACSAEWQELCLFYRNNQIMARLLAQCASLFWARLPRASRACNPAVALVLDGAASLQCLLLWRAAA